MAKKILFMVFLFINIFGLVQAILEAFIKS